MSEVPRRPPLTEAERERNARQSTGVQVASGATAAARPVQRPDRAQIYQPNAGVPLPVGDFTDTGNGTYSGTAFAMAAGDTYAPDFTDTGSDPGYTVNPTQTSQVLADIIDYFYTSHVNAIIQGAAPGDVFTIQLQNGGGARGRGDGFGIADAAGICHLFAVAGPLGSPTSSVPFSVGITMLSGTGTAAFGSDCYLRLLQIGALT